MKLCGTEIVYCSVVEMKLMVAMVKLCSLNDFVGCCVPEIGSIESSGLLH